MDEITMMNLLKVDLQRMGGTMREDEYILHLLRAAKASLLRQGIRDDNTEDYSQAVISTAAWMNRKRVSGEDEPKHLRRLRLDLLVSQKAGDLNA